MKESHLTLAKTAVSYSAIWPEKYGPNSLAEFSLFIMSVAWFTVFSEQKLISNVVSPTVLQLFTFSTMADTLKYYAACR